MAALISYAALLYSNYYYYLYVKSWINFHTPFVKKKTPKSLYFSQGQGYRGSSNICQKTQTCHVSKGIDHVLSTYSVTMSSTSFLKIRPTHCMAQRLYIDKTLDSRVYNTLNRKIIEWVKNYLCQWLWLCNNSVVTILLITQVKRKKKSQYYIRFSQCLSKKH